jgi:hypothetical protein
MVANGVVYLGKNNSRVCAYAAAGCGDDVCSPLYVTGSNFGTTPELYVFQLVGADAGQP